MPQSTQFPVALHLMISLTLRPNEWMNSESLAWSVDTNPSLVRRILSALGRAGLVKSQVGAWGGSKLAVDPARISLLEVYEAVRPRPQVRVHAPNRRCPLGAVLQAPLQEVLDSTDAAVELALAEQTLSELAEKARRSITQRARKKKRASRRKTGGPRRSGR